MYFSKQIGDVFEIEKGVTQDGGRSWSLTPLTNGSSQSNIRPVAPQGYDGPGDLLLWMRGRYIHYTDYETQIVLETPGR